MIPKIIFTILENKDEIPLKFKSFIESWHKINPDYKIQIWINDFNFHSEFDWLEYKFIPNSINLKYEFYRDKIKEYVFKKFGGIYLDLNIECIKSFDDLLDNSIVRTEFPNRIDTSVEMIAKENFMKEEDVEVTYCLPDVFIAMDKRKKIKFITSDTHTIKHYEVKL